MSRNMMRRLMALGLTSALAACGDDASIVAELSTADASNQADVAAVDGGADVATTDAAGADANPTGDSATADVASDDGQTADGTAPTEDTVSGEDSAQTTDSIPGADGTTADAVAADADDAAAVDAVAPGDDAATDSAVLPDAAPADDAASGDGTAADSALDDSTDSASAEDTAADDAAADSTGDGGAAGEDATGGGDDTTETPSACKADADCQNKGAPPLCQAWTCENAACVLGPAVQGTVCDDGNACTSGDACGNGLCLGKPLACDDGNPCTADACDAVAGVCSFPAADVPCDDGNVCTTGDGCSNGKCVAGLAKSCNDGNPCTDDSCDPKAGCQAVDNAAPCTPTDACLTVGVCASGQCKGSTPKDCDDKNPCTADACVAGACSSTAAAGFCDDGDACTEGDACKDGQCASGIAKGCGDGNPCTADQCDKQTGACSNPPSDGPCDAGDKCLGAASCQQGACVAGAAISCDDNNPCTDDGCDKAKGCTHLDNTAPCDNPKTCVLGVCAAGACKVGSQQGCDDSNPCTTDTCEPGKGCVYTAVADKTVCGDGNACIAASLCVSGACVAGKVTVCEAKLCTDATCDPKDGCVWTPNKAACDDGNACTKGDACNNGKCISGVAVDPKTGCDDGNGCTTDACDPKAGCTHTNTTAPCDDGNICTNGEACAAGSCSNGKLDKCDDGKVCTQDVCDAKTGDCSWVGVVGPCEDGNPCTAGDTCKGVTCEAGPLKGCDDGNSCTTDSCDAKAGKCVNTVKAGADVPACDGAVVGGRCVKAFAGANSWANAEKACQAWGGGHLVRIANATENGSVRQLASQTCGNNAATWIGLNDLVAEGKYVWADGTPANYFSWSQGEPNNCDGCCGAPEDVVQMLGNGTWNDICTNQTAACFVCDRPLPAVKCDDGSACSSDDTCVSGACVGAKATCDDANPCTTDSCDPKTGCVATPVADGTACGTGFACTKGVCSLGSPSNPAKSCAELKAAGAGDGLFTLDPDGKDGPIAALQTQCNNTRDGGGWTLVAISANDGQNTWTWNNRLLWSTNTTLIGSPTVLNKDFKSAALHVMPFKDLLFVHAPSDVWASYYAVGDGKQSLAQRIGGYANVVCWQPGQGFPLSAGTLKAGGKLCSSNLFFNAHDHDGNATQCGDDDPTFGPSWSASNNGTCPFDDPGLSGGLGPQQANPTVEQAPVGFGFGLNLNSGANGSGANRMSVWVR
jgi:hypothetical protein